MAAQQAVHFIGLPEGALALAELVVYLAAAPKSNAVYRAYGEAAADALTTRADPVPLWIRNAPTGLMKDLGYGKGYRYAHDEAEGVSEMTCLPDSLADRRYYAPTPRGAEEGIGSRLEAARRIRSRGSGRISPDGPPPPEPGNDTQENPGGGRRPSGLGPAPADPDGEGIRGDRGRERR
jgi:putative ATPase